MIPKSLFLLLLLLAPAIRAQEPAPEKPAAAEPVADEDFMKAFAANLFTAQWLAGYDLAAWHSGDEFTKSPKATPEFVNAWFAYREEDGWHVVYGKYDEEHGAFARTAHHRVDSPEQVVVLEDLEGRDFDVPFARALLDSGKRLQKFPAARRSAWNPYVRKVGDQVEVWCVPQVAPDWTIVHGLAFCWTYDAEGRELVKEEKLGYGLRGVKPVKDERVLIGDPSEAVPTVGDLFVAIRFGHLFGELGVRSETGISTRLEGLGWTHLAAPGELEDD